MLLKALSHKEMGAALTLHRVSRLEKKGHKTPPSPPLSPEPSEASAALPLHLQTEPKLKRIIPRQNGLLLERRPVSAELLSARFSFSVSATEDEVPVNQSAVSEGGVGRGISHTFTPTCCIRCHVMLKFDVK